MYFIPLGLLIKTDAAFLGVIGKNVEDYATVTWTNFVFVNLLPVTIGNMIEGAFLVGLVYWFIYLRPAPLLVSTSETAGSAAFPPRTEAR